MARKVSKKKLKVWSCKEGCDLSKTACSHLEKLIAPKQQYGVKLIYVDPTLQTFDASVASVSRAISGYRDHSVGYENSLYSPTTEETIEFIKTLKQYGMDSFQVELMVARFVKDMTFDQIVKEYGWLSKSTLHAQYEKAIAVLKTNGFKPRKEI